MCFDTENSDLFAEEMVVVRVDGNPNCPIFNSSQYIGTVPHNAPPSSYVLTVNAKDVDQVSQKNVYLCGENFFKFSLL